ncbi:MAG: exo-alpha-sialidase, partial [Clostridia bacterium]|nr:exo-alpha-sialidase [Clostridia bacterium]
EFSADPFLREEKRMGCNASFLRVEADDLKDASLLPRGADGITVFCNPRADTRTRMTACVSFDSGAHFSEARVIFDGPSAYSSLDYDKKSGHFFLLYERGDAAKGPSAYTEGLYVAEFDLAWLLSAAQ